MTKFPAILAALTLVSSAVAFAGPCDLSLTKNSMKSDESAQMAANGIAQRDVAVGSYFVSYIFAEANFDAELAMGIYTSCGEQAGRDGLGDFITKSEMKSPDDANPFQVYYEQAGVAFWSGGEYTVENTVSRSEGGYLMTTKLLPYDNGFEPSAFSPKLMDGYVRMVPEGANKVFVIACNYMVPTSPPPFSNGTYNKMAKDRLHDSGVNLMAWVKRVSQGQGKEPASTYRDRLTTLLSH